MALLSTPSGVLINQDIARPLSSNGVSLDGGTSSPTPTLSGSTPPSGTGSLPGIGADPSGLSASLTSAFDPTQNTIMSNYNAAKSLTAGATKNLNQSISDRYGQDISYQQTQDQNSGTGMLEGGRGFVINPGAVVAFQQQADKRVKDLRNQMNDALLNNNASGAKALSDLMVNEQTAITSARTAFLNQYFGSQQEARSQASFQTPEQQAVMGLAGQHPDAGVTPNDTLAQATAKVQASHSYQQNLAQGQANINQANANASFAGAQSQQIQTVLGSLKNNGTYQSDVSGLLNGSTSDATLHAKYDNFPGGLGGAIISNIESQAQSQGWSPQQSMLNTAGQRTATEAANSGNPLTMVATGANHFIGTAANKVTGTITSPSANANTLSKKNTGTTKSGLGYTVSQ